MAETKRRKIRSLSNKPRPAFYSRTILPEDPATKKDELRIAKRILKAQESSPEAAAKMIQKLSDKDRKIADRLKKSLARRKIKLEDYVNNVKGVRDKKAWHTKRADERRGMGDRPEIKYRDVLEKEKMRRLKGVGLRKHGRPGPGASAGAMESGRGAGIGNILRDPSGMEPGPQPKSYLKRKDAKPKRVLGRSPGDPFRKDKQLKKVTSASPTGTVDPGVKSKASAPTRRGDERITIKSGDTLSDLAKARGTTLAAIRRSNPDRFPTAKSLNIIKAGEKINMPPNVGATTPYDTKTVRVKPKVVPTPKRKPKQGRTAQEETARISRTGGETPFSQSKQKKKKTTETQKPGLMPWDWKRTDTTGPTDLGLGKREYETLFGKMTIGEDPEETARKAREFEETNYKKGGQVKKGVKKTKAKARRRAALRGHRAELRGG